MDLNLQQNSPLRGKTPEICLVNAYTKHEQVKKPPTLLWNLLTQINATNESKLRILIRQRILHRSNHLYMKKHVKWIHLMCNHLWTSNKQDLKLLSQSHSKINWSRSKVRKRKRKKNNRQTKQLKERKSGYFEHQKMFMRLENNQAEFTISAINETPPAKDILNNYFAISGALWLQHSNLLLKCPVLLFWSSYAEKFLLICSCLLQLIKHRWRIRDKNTERGCQVLLFLPFEHNRM